MVCHHDKVQLLPRLIAFQRKYVDLDHRAQVRAALVGDTEWNTKYMAPMRPMLVAQNNIILHKFPWSALNQPVNATNIYELRQYTVKPGSLQNCMYKSKIANSIN